MSEEKSRSRNSAQRNLVLSLMQGNYNHPTADEIYESARKIEPHISRGTVYRNLNFLAESNQIAKIMVPNGADHFDSTLELHYHFHCNNCDKLFDVPRVSCSELDLVSVKMKEQGFAVDGHNLIFTGICPVCSKKQSQ